MGALYRLYHQPTKTLKMGAIDDSTKGLKSALIFEGIEEALQKDGEYLVKKSQRNFWIQS